MNKTLIIYGLLAINSLTFVSKTKAQDHMENASK